MPKKKLYTIIDVETTGGTASREKITEIGIVLFDGDKILKTYDSLVDPERTIPSHITRITGITNDMISDAPKFYEIAKEIVEITESAVFVAHNVRFDYSFIKEEFARLGYSFTKRQLCTVRLSRKTFPGLRSYSLGNLIRHFGIKVNARHRVLEDALATTDIFKRILDQDESSFKTRMRETRLPSDIEITDLEVLPEATGVYYFHNDQGHVIYIGKSISIKKRVFHHFSKITRKSDKLVKSATKISYTITGSELVSLLLENEEIKKHQPDINRALRKRQHPYFIHHFIDLEGYVRFGILNSNAKNREGKVILEYCTGKEAGKSYIQHLVGEYQLCKKLGGLENPDGHCFGYNIEQCHGACIGEESPEDYNERVVAAIELFKRNFDKNMLIIDEGRVEGESSVVLVEGGRYQGFGYISNEDVQYGVEELKEAVEYRKWHKESDRIIRTYLENKTPIKIIEF